MLAIAPNPGFVLIAAGLLMLATPRALRAPLMAGAAFAALWLLLEHDFGAAAAVAQMGLPVVLLDLDSLNRVFGIALLIALVALSIFAHARPLRFESAALLFMAGGSVSALFVGDLVSFVAAAALAGLGASWAVFSSPLAGASRAGARLLVWNGLEGLLLLVGVAFHLSSGAEASVFARMDAATIGGGFILAALAIRVGAPLAHVWVKDTVAHASPLGGAALAAFGNILGIYALARFFPAEPLLMYVGAAMIVVGALYAAAVDDLRAGAVYAQLTQTGVCVALIGVGTPMALAGAEAHAFASVLAFAALQMALGAVVERKGHARVSDFAGLAAAMPITVYLLLAAGLAAAGLPPLAMHATRSIGLEATAQWNWLWLLIGASSAAVLIAAALRPALAAHRRPARPQRFYEAPFTMLLGAGVAAFYCLAIGLAPGWLYGLLPTALAFDPFALDRIAPQLELMGAAGAMYLAARAVGLAPKDAPVEPLDLDAFYRGPVAGAGRWAGVLLLRVYGEWQDAVSRLTEAAGRGLGAWMRACDRPYLGAGWATLQLWALAALVAAVLAGVRL